MKIIIIIKIITIIIIIIIQLTWKNAGTSSELWKYCQQTIVIIKFKVHQLIFLTISHFGTSF